MPKCNVRLVNYVAELEAVITQQSLLLRSQDENQTV